MSQASCVATADPPERGTDSLIESAAVEGFCGEPDSVAGFSLDHRGERYTIPRYVEIRRFGGLLFQDKTTTRWLPPYNGVEYASFGEFLLIRTFETDCIELDRVRLFMISRDGSVIHQRLWTSNWRSGFFVDRGRLAFWSEYFCLDGNTEREGSASYLYVFSEEDEKFEQKPVDASLYCPDGDDIHFLEFEAARPLHAGE